MKKIVYTLLTLVTTSGMILTSCSRDFTETQFHQSELAGEITTVEQLQSFVNGTYAKMRSSSYLGNMYLSYGEARSDEMYNTQSTNRLTEFTNYTLTSSTSNVSSTWKAIYEVIGNANIVINTSENITWGQSSNASTVAVKVRELKGQAYAARALATFDLLRLYGQKYTGGTLGVVLPTVYNPNAIAGRASIIETEAQIEADFTAALNNIGSNTNPSDKTFISPLAVKALMTRYYLYKGDYTQVANLAREIHSSGVYSVATSSSLTASFSTPNTPNSIFELAVGINGALGTTSYSYMHNSRGYSQFRLLPSTMSLYDTNDIRTSLYNTNGFLNNKFSSLRGDSNIKIIRYEEVLLNGAEAEINLGNTAQALIYYNLIRENRGLTAATSVTLSEIKNERIRELVGEGFRYWDLLRWGETIPYYTSDGTRDTSKDKTIGNNLLAMPIPQSETNVANSPIQPNPGYDN